MSKSKSKKTDLSDKSGAAAWARVRDEARPLSAQQKNRHIDDIAQPQKPKKSPKSKTQAEENTKNGQNAAGIEPTPPPPSGGEAQAARRASSAPPRAEIDMKARRRLGRGRVPIEATLDMHGMRAHEAEAALIGFIAYHRAQGHQWVLVITGKGMRGEGRLRKALPDWLARPPLSAQVAEYDAAGMVHGGTGAFYLRLRR